MLNEKRADQVLCVQVCQRRSVVSVGLRNFNSPNHGSNIQHLKHQAKTNLIKSVVTGQPTKLLRRRSKFCTFGNTKSKCSRHIVICYSVICHLYTVFVVICASYLYFHHKISPTCLPMYCKRPQYRPMDFARLSVYAGS